MKIDIGAIGSSLASLVFVALRSFVGTILVMILAGGVLAGLSCYFLREYQWFYGAGAVAVVIIESVTIGCVLGAKRAMIMAVSHGLGTLRLGRSLVRVIFERMLGIAEDEAVGQRGGRIVRGVEQLPLAQADELLSNTVRGMAGDTEQGGWLRRKIRTRLLEAIRKLTLSRFREEDAKHGGIDLLKVKEELEQKVDDVLVQKVRGGLRLWTALVVIGLPVLVAMQTYVVILMLHHKG